jgi:hypothetical protein
LKGLRKIWKRVGVSVYPFLLGRKMIRLENMKHFRTQRLKYGILHTVLKISDYQRIIVQNINLFIATCYYSSDAPRMAITLCANTDVMH